MKDWEDIRFIMHIVRHGGLQPAASKMGLSHSTLSRRLASLEAKLDTSLFERVSGRLVPNGAALDIAQAGEAMERNASELDLGLFAKKSELEGTLKITAAGLLIDGFLAPHLVEFSRLYPQVELQINAAHANLNLSKREADVAIRATNSPEEGLFGRRVSNQKRATYTSKDYLDWRGQQGGDEVKDLPWDWLGFDWWQGDEVAQTGGKIIARFDDMAALRSALRAGMGVAKLPCFLGENDPQLIRLPETTVEDYVQFWVLTHATLKDVARIRVFMAFVADKFAQSKSLFEGWT